MIRRWTNQQSKINLQGNQLSYSNSSQSNFNTKAYINPQMVNYEFIKRSLSKSSLKGGNKIHVNPNFQGNGLSSLPNGNNPHLFNAVKPQKMLLRKPELSEICDISEKKSSINSCLNTNETSCGMTMPLQSCFKKVNAVSVKNNLSYSWSKAKNNSGKSHLNFYYKNMLRVQDSKPSNYSNPSFAYKYCSPKKSSAMLSKSYQSENNQVIYKSRTKLIKAKTKLLNQGSLKNKFSFRENIHKSIKRHLYNYDYKNCKKSVLQVAKAVRNKYKYLKNSENFKKSKYKIDKRIKVVETNKKTKTNAIKDLGRLFPDHFYNKIKWSTYNLYNCRGCKSTSQGICLQRKNQHLERVHQKIINKKYPNQRVVKIGGILYKSTASKLTLAGKKPETRPKVVNTAAKAKQKYVVYVRGEKFILQNNGKALKRQSDNETNERALLLTPKRIDIGGVTYIQKSKNVLICTNVHQARQLVNKAKSKSIALLTTLHKRSSMPCMIYHRFGRCNRYTKGLCIYKHDPKNIAVCKKFLKGNCDDKNCFLSHQVVQEKMATCQFFLNGLCVRENCPFLHVKLNKNAVICKNFLQGFCNLGKDCSKRHIHQCPEFDKSGSCNLGHKCPYPHKKLNKLENLADIPAKQKNETETLKYYVHSNIENKQKKMKRCLGKVKESPYAKVQRKATKKKSLCLNDYDQSSSVVTCLPRRIKLDQLPCFIPLNSDS